MNIVASKSTFKTLKPGDKGFSINDGMMVAGRAGFEISRDCPNYYVKMIEQAVQYGWLKPVATLTEREYIFMGLSNDTTK